MTSIDSPRVEQGSERPDASEGSGVLNEISVLDVLIVFAKHKWLIGGLSLAAGVVAAVMSLRMTEIYTATAKLLPPQQNQSVASTLIAQLGQFGSLFTGASGALGLKNPSELYVGMLRSRTIVDTMIDRFNLMEVYKAERRSDARNALAGASQIAIGKDGLITLEVQDSDPKRAAAIANAYVDELIKFTDGLALTEAGQRRLFFERQLARAKESLLQAELAARSALDGGGLAAVDAQGRSMIQMSANLRARVTIKEVELNAMRGFATEQNPQFNRVQRELVALRSELAKLERGDRAEPSKAGKEEGLKNVALLREVRYQEVLFELLSRQYELAKMDEARDSGVIQLLDKAVEPDRRTSPKRTLIVLVSMFIAAFAGIFVAFLLEALERARRDPDSNRRLDELASYLLAWRR